MLSTKSAEGTEPNASTLIDLREQLFNDGLVGPISHVHCLNSLTR
jgi:hypothetical protein